MSGARSRSTHSSPRRTPGAEDRGQICYQPPDPRGASATPFCTAGTTPKDTLGAVRGRSPCPWAGPRCTSGHGSWFLRGGSANAAQPGVALGPAKRPWQQWAAVGWRRGRDLCRLSRGYFWRVDAFTERPARSPLALWAPPRRRAHLLPAGLPQPGPGQMERPGVSPEPGEPWRALESPGEPRRALGSRTFPWPRRRGPAAGGS